ncbi:hypothetical protein H5410_047521, partial [Solanum commersonii]
YGLPKLSDKLNHLVYADDTIIFAAVDKTSLQLIMEFLINCGKGHWFHKRKFSHDVFGLPNWLSKEKKRCISQNY